MYIQHHVVTVSSVYKYKLAFIATDVKSEIKTGKFYTDFNKAVWCGNMSLIVAVLTEWLPLLAVGLLVAKLATVFLKRRTLQELFKEFPGPKPELFSGNTREVCPIFLRLPSAEETTVIQNRARVN